MVRQFFRFCFWISGWKMRGQKPDLSKYVLIIAPHTSNWDFFVALAARHISEIRSSFLIKNSITKIPVVGWFIRAVGGRGVDRAKNNNLVGGVVEMYQTEPYFIMTITPEGTRSYSPRWKSGFYQIALRAGVPIQCVGMDFAEKFVEFGPLIYPSGNYEEDLETIKSYFRPLKGKYPELGVD